jgi:hypothetical protein
VIEETLFLLLGSASKSLIEAVQRESAISWESLIREPEALSRAMRAIAGTRASQVVEKAVLKRYAERVHLESPQDTVEDFAKAVTEMQNKAKAQRANKKK